MPLQNSEGAEDQRNPKSMFHKEFYTESSSLSRASTLQNQYSPPVANSPVPQPSNNNHTLENTGYCLLSFDGGGVRGLSSLYILQGIMRRLNFEREEAGLRPRRPCEIFDLIGGTSTGGLIAIMLGRLEMTVDECIDAYIVLMKKVFGSRENRSVIGFLGGVKPRFSSLALKDAIAQVLRGRGIDTDEKFENGSKPQCKVFVCTNFQKTNTITRLRNYRTPRGTEFHPTIIEAALATAAAPTYFSDINIGGSHFLDGAIGANNPTFQVEAEAADLWCEDTGDIKPLTKCFISIGTGGMGVRSVTDKGMKHLLETIQKEATQTEATNQQFLGQWRELFDKGRCFRFNVKYGLENVKLAEFEQRETMQAATAAYLDDRDTMSMVRMCVENLRTKQYHPDPEFVKRLQKDAAVQANNRPSAPARKATASEIMELTTLGNAQLKIPPSRITMDNLLSARQYFSKALNYLQSDPSTSPKQVSRICQKLMETSIGLSMAERDPYERSDYAEQAQNYGETALENVERCNDECMAAQMEFLLACVTVWKVYLVLKSSGRDAGAMAGIENARVLMKMRLDRLREFPNLDIGRYEDQSRTYLGYLHAN